jgi:hypothetical protein
MHQIRLDLRHIIAYLIGGIAALLLARLVLRLFAVRPDHPVIAALLAGTAPPQVLASLDAGQPRFGATLEFATLVLIVLVLIVGLGLRYLWKARPQPEPGQQAARE